MPKKSMSTLTESMFYVLMALLRSPMCGIDIAAYVQGKTKRRVQLGPATLYTVLGKFAEEGYIQETEVSGRKRTYAITDRGREAYDEELARLRQCILDAEAEDDAWLEDAAPRQINGSADAARRKKEG